MKKAPKSASSSVPRSPIGAKSRQQHSPEIEHAITLRAYELFEQRGKEPGHEIDDWLQAENEVTKGS
jgi:hypothetical protein